MDAPVSSSDDLVVFFRPSSLAGMLSRSVRMWGAQPAIKQFCVNTGAVKRGGAAAKPVSDVESLADTTDSHNMYGNLYGLGRMAVPQGPPTQALAQAYVNDFQAGWLSALTENKPPGAVKFYLDLDLELDTYPSEEWWRQLEALEKREVARFFPGRLPDDPVFKSVVATCGVMDVYAPDGTVQYKCGIHVYYPNMFVTVDMALYMSTAILSAAKRTWPEAPGVWEKRIDRGVYGPSRGLRWVWQVKAKKCAACASTSRGAFDAGPSRKRPASAWCDQCQNSGQVVDPSASMYSPLYRVDGRCRREPIVPHCRNKPTVELMLECSLRYIFSGEPTEGFVLYPGVEPIPVLKTAPKKAGADVLVTCSGDAQLQTALRSASEQLTRDSSKWRALQDAIRRVNHMYKDLEIDKALAFKGKGTKTKSTYYKVFVRGKGSGFCMNYGRDHRSARVYFVVLKSGVSQRCWCKCDTTEHRDSGKRCREFESKVTPLFQHETSSLFEVSGPWNIFASSSPTAAGSGPAVFPSLFGATECTSSSCSTGGASVGDVDAFSAVSNGSVFVRDLKLRLPSFFDYGHKGSITAVARAQRHVARP